MQEQKVELTEAELKAVAGGSAEISTDLLTQYELGKSESTKDVAIRA